MNMMSTKSSSDTGSELTTIPSLRYCNTAAVSVSLCLRTCLMSRETLLFPTHARAILLLFCRRADYI